MSFTIKHGLFRTNITDYHAILGVSLDADPKTIRLKYLRIAQKLHPDTCKANPEEKKLASQILSRLVNPAYEELSNKTHFAEHQLVLTQIGKRYAEKSDRITFASEPAKQLLKADEDIDRVYNQILEETTSDRYKSINKVLTNIAVVSEINFVYLMLKQDRGINREERVVKQNLQKQANKSSQTAKAQPQPKPQPKPQPQQPTAPTNNSPEPEEPSLESRVASYIRRAKEYMEKEKISDMVLELRDGLKIDPNNSTCHALMGEAYLLQNQLTMAKVHINKAYQSNPKDPVAIASKEKLDKLIKKQQRGSGKSSAKNSDKKKKSESSFFGGLFGAKKK